MEGKGPLKQDAAYKALEAHYSASGKDVDIAKAFAADSKRFDKFRWVVSRLVLVMDRLTLSEVKDGKDGPCTLK